jgi:hypothetical protein
MNQRLEFLKFLTKQSNCKTLTNQQINVLWECLVVNAFSEEERDQFFIFCTEVLNAVQVHQYKVQQQSLKNSRSHAAAQESYLAGELLFDEDTLEMIFFEILLRLDFRGSGLSGNSFTQ